MHVAFRLQCMFFLLCQSRVRSVCEWPRLLLQGPSADVTAPRCCMTESLIHQPTVPKICDHLVLSVNRVTQCSLSHTQTHTHTHTHIHTALSNGTRSDGAGERRHRATLPPQRPSVWPRLTGFFKGQRSKRLLLQGVPEYMTSEGPEVPALSTLTDHLKRAWAHPGALIWPISFAAQLNCQNLFSHQLLTGPVTCVVLWAAATNRSDNDSWLN